MVGAQTVQRLVVLQLVEAEYPGTVDALYRVADALAAAPDADVVRVADRDADIWHRWMELLAIDEALDDLEQTAGHEPGEDR